jgi:hypothetical protein
MLWPPRSRGGFRALVTNIFEPVCEIFRMHGSNVMVPTRKTPRALESHARAAAAESNRRLQACKSAFAGFVARTRCIEAALAD